MRIIVEMNRTFKYWYVCIDSGCYPYAILSGSFRTKEEAIQHAISLKDATIEVVENE